MNNDSNQSPPIENIMIANQFSNKKVQNNIQMSNTAFRLFTTKADYPQEGEDADEFNRSDSDCPQVTGVDEDEKGHCEAMVACENLPNEPLKMPRSHKSSARSFLKNIG